MFDLFYIQNPIEGINARKVSSIEEARELSRTRYCWILNYLCDYTDFDFLWEPVPWESHQRHAWASQHQNDSGTYLVPKNGYEDTNYHDEQIQRKIPNDNVILLDHGNDECHKTEEQLKQHFKKVTKTRFISSYLGTLRRVISKCEEDWIWVTSSLIDYKLFPFSWHGDEWQQEMMHVFPANNQKFGDTFLINVKDFNKKIPNTEILEWYDTIHYVDWISTVRWPIPLVEYDTDNLPELIKEHTFKTPLVKFKHKSCNNVQHPTINMWREKTRTVVPLSGGNGVSIVPRDAKNYIQEQVYDYPYIDKEHIKTTDIEQDIVFISYDEMDMEKNWKILKDKFPRAKRVHGVDGMDNALKEAARQSDTEWYFAVFAKTQIHEDFGFDFKPDRFQQPKHYIFNAENVMNGLVYGHMGIVLYNCNIIKNMTDDFGIDYTMSAAHEVVDQISAYATFNTSPYQTWRTAFRECSKLAQFNDETPNIESEYRLDTWVNQAKGEYAEWCLNGANDGVEYYKQNAGNKKELMKAFRWDWLREYFVAKYGNID